MDKNIVFEGFREIVSILQGSGIGNKYPLKQIYPVLRMWLYRNFYRKYEFVDGHKFYMDNFDSMSLSSSTEYEPFETSVFKSLIHEGDTIIVCGANIGYYPIIASDIIGESGRIYAYEPTPETFQVFLRNIKENNCSNIVPINSAVSDHNGYTNFKIVNGASNHISNSFTDNKNVVCVPLATLDEMHRNQKIDLVLMDIEGFEHLAFNGMEKLLSSNPKIKLIMEFGSYYINEAGLSPKAFLEDVAKHGFKISDINELTKTVYPMSIEALLARYPIHEQVYTNLLCER